MPTWKASSINFFLGIGGLGLFLWFLMSGDKSIPFGLIFTVSFSPVALHCFLSLDFWTDRLAKVGQQLALKLYLCVALISAVVSAVHGFDSNYVFPGVLILIGAWPCVLAQLAARPKPFKQVKYQQPANEVDGSLVIKSSPLKLTWLIILVGLLLAMTTSAIPSLAGWAGTVLLGPLLLLAIYIYRPSANYLRIDHNGIEVVIAGQHSATNWGDIVGFHVGDNNGDMMVGILYTDAYLNARAGIPMESGHGWIRNIFTMRPEVLCAVLTEWHATTVGSRPAKLQEY